MTLRKASRRVSLYYDACLAGTGLRATQFAILAMIGKRSDMSVKGLADALGMDRSTAGQNLRPLEREQWVEMARSEADGRARIVRLTPLGTARLGDALPHWQRAQRQFEAANGKDVAAELRSRLQDLRIPD
jgi:DNA-binding MarR family transcriptional regulator